jgi:VWFA-related protein
MRELRVAVLLPLFVLIVPGHVARPAGQQFTTETLAITVDVVVHDEDGNVVRCLGPDDFEVFENGDRQTLTAFERIGQTCGGEPASKSRARADGKTPSAAERLGLATPPSVTAIVFHELGPEARAAAWRAANVFIEEVKEEGGFAGVFVLRNTVEPIQPYTSDAELLRLAAREAAMRPGCPQGDVDSDVPSAAGGGLDCPKGEGNVVDLNNLQEVVRTLSVLPGRKALIVFSEGFQMPLDSLAPDRFERIVSLANHHRVTIHTLDAQGLRAVSPRAGMAKQMRTYDATAHPSTPGNFAATPPSGHEITSGDPTTVLAWAAHETGGRFIENTNDLSGAVRGLAQDLREGYMLAYTPANTKLDGRFRTVEVRVKRTGVRVYSRRGYLASLRPTALTVAPHEAAPLMLLDSGAVHETIPVEVAVRPVPGGFELGVHLAASDLTFSDTADGFHAGVTVLARAMKGSDQMLALTSRTVALAGTREELEAARQRRVAIPLQLSFQGDATALDVVVYDIVGRTGTVRRVKL